MALLGNYNIFTKNPILNVGGDSTSGIVGLRYNWNQAGVSRLRFYGDNDVDGVTDRCGLPANYSAPYAWILPPKAGGLGSNVGLKGLGDFAGSGALGRNIDATMEGSGTISNANLGLILSAVATLSGIGGLSADVSGALQASATLAGSGDMTGALGALAGAIATLSGSGTLTSDITAKASLSADIYVNQSEASVQQIVDGVGNALASQYNTSGTMGEAAQTGGGGFSSQAIQSTINNAKREIIEKIENIPQVSIEKVETQLSEIESQNEIAKTEILDTIKASENEICSDVIRKTKEIKEDNVKTRNLVRQKSEKIDKNVSKLADRQDMTDQMIESEAEEIERIIEQNIDIEADNIESEINKQIDKEIEEIESNQNANGNNNGTEG